MTDWKRKLAAYLHDPPSKALDIRTHGERSDAAFKQAGFSDTEVGEYFAHADHTAAAMDRLPFPRFSAGIKCAFDGVRNAFLHPLSGEKLPFHAEFTSMEQVFSIESAVQPVLSPKSIAAFSDDAARWQARFFAHWRLWPKHSMENDYRLALLPADTRIPDHSIWTHMQVVSALDGCVGENKVFQPAFLKFQLGPVQDFIAAARSIRDLWSGSYLLSWLMAAGLKAISAEVGPDSVVFPSLRSQPLFDLHWRDELWAKAAISDQTSVWDSLGWTNRDLLTPNLPNVFLSVVPADRAAELGRKVEAAIRAEWKRIAESVWNECEKGGLTADEPGIGAGERRTRFDSQIRRLLSVSWQMTPWPDSLEDALKVAEGFDETMPVQESRQRVLAVVGMATERMPLEDRDGRYYTDGTKTKLNNRGLAWSVIVALNSWELDAVRQTRSFAATNIGGWNVGTFNNKDVLTGRDEAVAGGSVWAERTAALGGAWVSLFKHGDWMSAATLVKRVWHSAYLSARPWNLETNSREFPMPNTRGIAAHDPFANDKQFNDEETSEDIGNQPEDNKYFAVLAFDGDEIGKWVSGEKTPQFSSQLADYKDGSNIQRFGAKDYFEKPEFQGFLKAQRPLSPSYHLQFSEALSNFALLCARPIVEEFFGRLIYAGGDDVVALLPADTALSCAEALRAAFTGREVRGPDGTVLFRSPSPGFLSSEKWKDNHDRRRPIPFLVPGPRADASVGIAIAHFKSPLQDVVRAAQAAEKRAKKQLGRSAVAVSLFKRSGETIEWGCKWTGGGLEIYRALAEALDAGKISGKFPYRFAELLSPYLTQSTPLVAATGTTQLVSAFNAAEVIRQEFKHTLDRQRGAAFPTEREVRDLLLTNLTETLSNYLCSLNGENSEVQLRAIIGLCQTVAFAHRNRS
jgi:CRISPR-associated protein Cmr2